ncbi:peptidoglycan bridge formation glycyltransferase FemA/FemB family protein [Patescibacteria group bacterium]|nr:peptidoglycan bridge formation glycyltransferase FemA/FemB family protein [Patescibacteria group bacterium]
MQLNFEYIADKNIWEQNIKSFHEANFLQSWNWGVFQEAMGKIVTRLLVRREESLVAMAQLVKETAKRGTYITIAGGPLLNWDDEEIVSQTFGEIKRIAKEQAAVFIRFRPQALNSEKLRDTVKKLGAVVSQMHLTADLTLQLDLSYSEEEILQKMRKNTRYSIKKAGKDGIVTVFSKDKNDIKQFCDFQNDLAKLHRFVPFSYDFLFNQFSAFLGDDQVLLIHSFKDDILLASAFIIFYNSEAVYHYGISTPENGKLPGSYACQWAAIREAKKRGITKYNFWGIAPEEEKNHRFTGVSIFKRGFGGGEVQYLPSHDIPLSAKYNLTSSFEFLRKKMRKL